MQSELNCMICRNQYNSDNLPRLLTACGHTYCQACLDTMITEDQDGRFKVVCHQDNIATFLESCDVSEFPKNIALLKVIESKKCQGGTFKDESFDLTKINRKDDSRGDQSQQEIINQIESGKSFGSSREETSSKEDTVGGAVVGVSGHKKEEYQLCLPHQKFMDIVCLEHMAKICPTCAIFGDHKGHEFKSIEQIEEEWDHFRQNIINIYAQKETLEKRIYNQENAKSILSIFQQNKKNLQKDLNDRLKRLRDAVKKIEEIATKKLEEVNSKIETKIRDQILKLDSGIANEYKAWEDKSFGLIIQTEECKLQQKLKNLYDYNNTRMIPQGEAILLQIEELQKQLPNNLEKIIKNVKIQSNEDVFTFLQNYIKIFEGIEEQQETKKVGETSKTKLKPQLTFEESLLESQLGQVKQEVINSPKSFKLKQPFEVNQFYALPEEPKIQMVSYNLNNHSSPVQNKRKESASMEGYSGDCGSFQKTQRPPKKKLKLIKVPQKMQKMLDLLYNDTLDLLDLTNAELGDSTILQICQFLRGSKVRSVKFIRNKLTDAAIPKIISAIGEVITLNLSQNLLTERTLQYFIANRNALPSLRSIILSQNKIIERKHKLLIERLRKLDLTVSI